MKFNLIWNVFGCTNGHEWEIGMDPNDWHVPHNLTCERCGREGRLLEADEIQPMEFYVVEMAEI